MRFMTAWPLCSRANACERAALRWESDEKLSKDCIDDVCKAAEAWIQLRDRVQAAAAAKEAAKPSREDAPAPREVENVTS